MSIEKRVFNDSFNWDVETGQILKIAQHGIDNSLRKYAEATPFAERLSTMKPIPGKTVLHLIALGDEERFGPNRNMDGFSRKDNQDRHHTFVTNGHVFKNHKNGHPDQAIGEVLDSTHNPDGHRVELLLAADNNKASTVLDRLEKTGQLACSMGSLQQHDVCSYCGHKAATPDLHCGHIKTALGEVMEDGQRIYMKNPHPTFFDISLLDLKPADRIGWTLKKVANARDSQVIGGHELPALCGITSESVKMATLNKLSLMEKMLTGVVQKATPSNLTARSKSALVKAAAKHGSDHVLNTLYQDQVLLSPSDFTEVILGLPAKTAATVKSGSFQAIQEDPLNLESLDGYDGQSLDLGLDSECRRDLDCNCKLAQANVVSRVLRNSLTPVIKTASTYEEEGLSQMYAYYKLAFAIRHRHDHNILRSVAAC